MIRKRTKKRLLEKLDILLEQLHEQLELRGEDVLEILSKCQEIAIEVGEELESSVRNCAKEICLLEEYCEKVYQYSIDDSEIVVKRDKLDELVNKVKLLIEQRKNQFLIIFMPYKASMWDSLESIWLATKKDEEIEAIVMPIPYYRYDNEKKELVFCYEGAEFPEDVPIVDFETIDLEKEQPDVIYIHNPYDSANFVTSVAEKYYSKELKKCTDNLVYVPYYVTKGAISVEQSNLPVYYNMDYMIVQSEYFKSKTDKLFFRDKVLALGSPKFDRIVQLKKEKNKSLLEVPRELGKKSRIFLNTSISRFLIDTSAMLKKLQFLFSILKERKDIEIIWRPHPLLEATIDSLRVNNKQEYLNVKQYFLENKIGILDTSADITESILSSDAYIGESASSLVSLFAVAEKPIFILNNYIYQEESFEEKCKMLVYDMIKVQNKWWFITDMNRLFVAEENFETVECVGQLEEQPKWNVANMGLTQCDSRIYFAPQNASYPAYYDIKNNNFGKVEGKKVEEGFHCGRVLNYQDKIFYLPYQGKCIYEYSKNENVWSTYSDSILHLHTGAERKCYESIYSVRREHEFLWMTATDVNRILRFNMNTGESQIFELGNTDNGYSGIEIDGENIWLAEVKTGDILKWDRRGGVYQTFSMPAQFQTWQSSLGRDLAHKEIYLIGDWIVTEPGFSNASIKLNVWTGEVTMLEKEFWQEETMDEDVPYQKEYFETSFYSKKIGEGTVLMQRRKDAAILIIDIEKGDAETKYLKLKKETLQEMLQNEDGFEKINKSLEFSCRENRYFSLNAFLDRIVENRMDGVLERQRIANKDLAINLDGSCGEKVHGFIKDVLQKGTGE